MQVMLGSRGAKTCSWRNGTIYNILFLLIFRYKFVRTLGLWIIHVFLPISCNNIHIRARRLYFQYVFTKKTVTRCTFLVPNFYVLLWVWQEHNLLLEIISSTLGKDTANPLSHHVMASSNLSKWTQALAPINEKKKSTVKLQLTFLGFNFKLGLKFLKPWYLTTSYSKPNITKKWR